MIPLVLDVELFLRAGCVFAFDDVVGFRPHAFDVAFLDQVCLEMLSAPQMICFCCSLSSMREKVGASDSYSISMAATAFRSACRSECASSRIGSSG